MALKREMNQMFTSKDRSVITRALTAGEDHNWTGTRKGFRVILRYEKGAPADRAVSWSALVNGGWRHGFSSMISDAMASVEQKVANRDWDARREAL